MTDQYDEVAAADLKDGDEAEIVVRGTVNGAGTILSTGKGYSFGQELYDVAHAIRRKVQPITVGDSVRHCNGAKGKVRGVDGDDIWVRWDHGAINTWPTSDLTRIPKTEPDWIDWPGGENPVPGKVVEVKFRDGEIDKRHADSLAWYHDADTDDIIAYRLPKTGGAS